MRETEAEMHCGNGGIFVLDAMLSATFPGGAGSYESYEEKCALAIVAE
jgi:hypothetical protein